MTADGMPTNSIFDIAQHPSGIMWFMTKAGPVYYDTKEWHAFPDSLNLPSSYDSKIVVSDGIIWVAGLNKTAFALQYYNGSWVNVEIPFDSNLVNSHISFNIYKTDTTHYSVIGSRNTLYVYDILQNQWTIEEIGDFSINSLHSINGQCVIASTDGLWVYQDGEIYKYALPYDVLPTKNILTLSHVQDTLFLLGFDWYAEIVDDSLKLLIDDAGLNISSKVTQSSLVVDETGMVFFSARTPARLINRQNGTWQNLLIKGENVNIGSTRIFRDIENNIWVSDSRGLFKFNVLQFTNYNRSSGLATDEVTVVKELSNGTVILANPYSINTLQNGVITKHDLDIDQDFNFRILDIEEDIKNKKVLVAVNDGGLLIYNIDNFDKPVKKIVSDHFRITSIEIFKNQIYAAGNRGFYTYENGNLKNEFDFGGIRNMNDIGDFLALTTTSKGVFLFNKDTLLNYTSSNFDLSSVYAAVDYHNEIVLATRNGLGAISKNGEIVEWPEININAPVYGLAVDSKDRLWIGSDHGVYLYQNNTLKLYDLDEGLEGSEINRNALYEDSKGQIWIGTEKGVSVFNKNADDDNNVNLKVDITEVHTEQNRSLNSFANNTLPYDFNTIEIAFQCLSYVDEENINFRYRINQSNKKNKWVFSENSKNNIIFSNIQNGNYQFEIQARLGTGKWGPITSFRFVIQKPFYIQWWFIAASVILLLAVARTVFYFRYVLLIRKQKKLKEVIAARTQEIRLLNEQLEEKVMLRTKELEDRTLRLEESAFINAHYLRAPLTKIMSILHILDASEEKVLDQKLIGILKESVAEMDEVIHSVNHILKK